MSFPTNKQLTLNNNKMKAGIFIAVFCMLSLSIFLAWSKFERPGDRLSISVSNNDNEYEFRAIYNENQTGIVQDYINDSIKPNGIFRSTHDYFNVSTTLADHTQFHIKSSPGELKIELDKRKNTTASYNRIKQMCDGISRLLTGK